MMNVNTSIVKALMYLRGIGEPTLASLVHVPLSDLQSWLYDMGENSEERVPFDTQMEILGILGVAGEGPRQDVVHYWRIHESFFSRPASSYWALNIMLKAFGKAQAVFISRESDPAFTFQARAHFGLRFAGFMVILEVTAHPLRSISFDPDTMADLSWVPDTFGVLLPDNEFDRLEPGSMKVKGLTQYLTYTTEMAQWERLRESALEQGIRAEQVASLLLGNAGPERLTDSTAPVHEAEPLREGSGSTEKPEPAVKPERTDKPTPPSPAAPVRSVDDVRGAPDDMRLFITPVKGAEKAATR